LARAAGADAARDAAQRLTFAAATRPRLAMCRQIGDNAINDKTSRGKSMRRVLIAIAMSVLALPAQADDDIVLRGMGSFHIGGRIAEVSGKPVKDIQRVPGGPVSKLDPNGQFMVEQMYTQFFLPKNRKGKYPLLLWHGGGLTGVTYESKAG
jgi:hypothetical protein